MIKEAIGTIVSGQSLTAAEAASVMEEIMDGKATPAQLSAFVTALRIKGETPAEIAGLAGVMRGKALQVRVNGPLLDIVGTGGDSLNTFNISTASAFVAAGAGLQVAKHGNRAASSKCGSADVLEALGVKLELTPEQVQQCINEVGIGFMFAAAFHPAMKYAAGPRKEIGIRTVFNILGPLTNPASAEYQVIGVPDRELARKIAAALCEMGVRRALVVNGHGGMDEIAITGPSIIIEVKNGCIVSDNHQVVPEDFGLPTAPLSTIVGGSPANNAEIIRDIFRGNRSPRRDAVLLNAAAGLMAGEKVSSLRDGVKLAAEVIDSGCAQAKLEQFTAFTRHMVQE